jgi:hypothetical protein
MLQYNFQQIENYDPTKNTSYSFEYLQEYAGSLVSEDLFQARLPRGLVMLPLRVHRFRFNGQEDGPLRVIVIPYLASNLHYDDRFGSCSYLDLLDAAKVLMNQYLLNNGYKVFNRTDGVPEIYATVEGKIND